MYWLIKSPTLSGYLAQQIWKLRLYDSHAFRLKHHANDAKSLFITALSAKVIQQVNHELTVCRDAN